MSRQLLLPALLVLAGCSRTPLGLGAASLLAPEERETVVNYVWTKRGVDFGVLARIYCLTGSVRERRVMLDAVEQNEVPAKVTIACPNE